MTMIDIALIQSFVLLMKIGSLTRVETQTGLSKATLSRQIIKLESDLGVQLLNRSTRRMVPTEAGRAFYAHCEALLLDMRARIDSAQTDVLNLSDGVTGTLSILADSHFSTSFVCHVVRLFLERFPNVHCQVDVVGRRSSPRVDEVDCYVCSEPPDHPNLVGKQIGRLTSGLFASPRYLAQHGSPSHPSELAVHKFIRLSEPASDLERRLHSKSDWYDFTAAAVMSTNDYWVMKTFCMDSFGIAVLPHFFAKPEVDNQSLQPLLAEWNPQPMHIYCAYQRQRYERHKLRGFIDLMSESVDNIASVHSYVGSGGKPVKP